jgi:S-adenosylmethionine:tRNA-ribosyltransferase-isomerase (queuine synthetase)
LAKSIKHLHRLKFYQLLALVMDEKNMHSEYYEISQDNVDRINQTKANGGRIIAIGTTAVHQNPLH